ncbi:OmpA family protein [Chromatocurvus halotolerans]|uniref:Outer membrane protein OmpA-like peptidoglycan-associated protein n=1 Tax=Chromatocurvus halotolerans TaxID=1132028 RepID=A0A4R2KQD9_9GAMM|nr:OmpA family protein [Chromatocurvus halotolerans]TCO74897.1 outer membrane protein OmpA-like peptidoglycan-associated protein [Chromatocurvus halotolerans]
MMIRKLLAVLLALVFAPSGWAQDWCSDVAGADHPQVPRYDGSCRIAHVERAYDEVMLPLGPAVEQDGAWVPEQRETLEGKSTRLMYLAPEGRSSLEVFRNYERSLAARGFEVLFSCSGKECDVRDGDRLQGVILPTARRIGNAGNHSFTIFNYGVKDRRYLTARSADELTWVGVFLAESEHIFLRTADKRRVAMHIDVLELEAMEERMVDAAALAKGIGEKGSVTLDNIYFDFGAATLTAESGNAIAEAARLLQDNPDLNIYVVGHTDSVGAYEGNLTLSRQRAEAVVEALASGNGIDRVRVVPAGVGPLAPVVSNATEAGRAQNRRVELVAR